jgi:hypothetical protein
MLDSLKTLPDGSSERRDFIAERREKNKAIQAVSLFPLKIQVECMSVD